ncbi:MAG: ISNCY family transposase [Thermoanaerobaculia bacterium]
MSERQWKRWDAIGRVNAEKLTMNEAARICGISPRQLRRLRRGIAEVGQAALVHGNTGRPARNRVSEPIRRRVVELRRGKYDRFNDQHFCEKLRKETAPILLGVRTVRRILREAGIVSVRRRRPRAHRRRRERKAQAGLMLLWDGSPHDWLEDRGPKLCLMGAIDDATSEVMPGAHFVQQECAAGYLRTLKAIVAELGIPWSIYMDQHGSLRRNDDNWTLAEELRGRQDPTQVGIALEALEIEPIFALSPQAKGRVERMWWTFQDRLVSELRLAGATTASQATAVVERYRLEHNERFAVAPRDRAPAWRPVRPGVDLDRICSFRYEATVRRDNAVRLAGMVIDIPPGPRKRTYADKRVEVRQILDGSWRIYDGNVLIATGPVSHHGELRVILNRKKTRGAPLSGPVHATFVEAHP